MLSKYYKGILKLIDIDITFKETEKKVFLTTSKIDINNLDLKDNKLHYNEITRQVISENKTLYENINNKAEDTYN